MVDTLLQIVRADPHTCQLLLDVVALQGLQQGLFSVEIAGVVDDLLAGYYRGLGIAKAK